MGLPQAWISDLHAARCNSATSACLYYSSGTAGWSWANGQSRGGSAAYHRRPKICDHTTYIGYSSPFPASEIAEIDTNPSALVIMALDPLSAFSVACNVLQIVETSLRVLGRSAECYKSGSLDEVSVIVGNVHTMEGLNNELKDILPDSPGRTPLSSAELRLVDANEQCLKLSGEFKQLLDGLNITKKSVWRSIGISVKSMWYQDKLASFEKAISEARANLTLAFLLLMQ